MDYVKLIYSLKEQTKALNDLRKKLEQEITLLNYTSTKSELLRNVQLVQAGILDAKKIPFHQTMRIENEILAVQYSVLQLQSVFQNIERVNRDLSNSLNDVDKYIKAFVTVPPT